MSTSLPVFNTLKSLRSWCTHPSRIGKSLGLVPTMGALHEGHLSLVRASLRSNDLTLISIFVNPAQFSPTEDLDAYPRTLERDLLQVTSIRDENSGRTPDGVFAPTVREMYPSGITLDVSQQRGTFVELKGYGTDTLEGKTRPGFFRGVATVVMKLFHAVEPDHAYFGQKDIQQALLLRRMVQDLLCSHPPPEGVHIVTTVRDSDGLALSSRNIYLRTEERDVAPILYKALRAGEVAFKDYGVPKNVREAAEQVIRSTKVPEGVELRLDYISFHHADTLVTVSDSDTLDLSHCYALSGAVWVGRTRLIDNILLGNITSVLQ